MFDLLSGTFWIEPKSVGREPNLVELRLKGRPEVGRGRPCHTPVLFLFRKGRLPCTFSPGRFSLVEPLSTEEILSWQGRGRRGRAGCALACGKKANITDVGVWHTDSYPSPGTYLLAM